MKKFLCLLFCVLGCLFFAFWVTMYVIPNDKTGLSYLMSWIMIVNVIVIVLSLIIGFSVIKCSVDQWFQNDSFDIMSIKDKLLIASVVLITIICAGIFVLTIINNNINSVRTTELDNMRLRMLMLILANTYMAYAYYQHFQIA